MENPTWNSIYKNSTRRPYNSDKRLFNISINFPQQSRAQFNFPGSQRKQYKS
ncbi:uncharacterized protein SETTUDRAFT_29294 [Exserohilum turcica Et28A]|uniref:Uncharacterized protein n=1 Tax=Exserohilum turcicum (strain 28A) TaxID=671987 RepID=R0K805_EXST2|nr:uncharacterized protein SETTUDRAFT_29294 [Exserohilum turcica Et28A]EOA84447.1 hypothetical protein SETTUDRAFT_29294 [Exserohilum turcica Et28A]